MLKLKRPRLVLGHLVAPWILAALAACGGGGGGDADTAGSRAAPAAEAADDRETAQAAVIAPALDGLVGTVTPTTDAHLVGMWTPVVDWPLLGIHANVLPNGRILTYGANEEKPRTRKAVTFDEWDTRIGLTPAAHREVASPTEVDSFCSASVMGPDGLLLIVGGNTFWKTAQYDPDRSLLIARASQMQQPRWYGTLVKLPDNRVVVVGGNNGGITPPAYGVTPEIFSAAEGWRPLTGASSEEAFGASEKRFWYPRAYLAPNGLIVGVSNDLLWQLDPQGEGRLTVLGPAGHRLGVAGTSVMYRPGKVLLIAGGETDFDREPATRKATVLDIAGDLPVSSPTAELNFARNYPNSLMLPDGRVLVTGGTTRGNGVGTAVMPAEMWDPDTGQWATWAPAAAARLYHSTSLLLPNGAVLNTGGGSPGPVFAKTAQVFFPPYFFKKRWDGEVVWADRPAIKRVDPYFRQGEDGSLRLSDSRRIASVALISAGAVTHGHSTDLRYVPVPFSQSINRVQLHLGELGETLLPPGHYQLHVVDEEGVPSSAAIVEVRGGTANVAYQGWASQSSTSGFRDAGAAIDGSWSAYSATSSSNVDPSWQLDFGSGRPIAGISLFNRLGECRDTDDCRSRLRDITVSVLDEAGNPVWTSGLLNAENMLQSPDRLHVDLTLLNGTAVVGHSVRVQRQSDPDLSGSGGQGGESEANVLALAEVEVEEGPVNLALRKPARQSHTAAGGVASRAVDGRFNATWRDGPLTFTGDAFQPWWEVDLGAVHPLRRVRLWNRIDCCSELLADFDVLVSDTPFGNGSLEEERARPGVGVYHVDTLKGERALEVALSEAQTGRYVRIWLNRQSTLSLAEVEVIGR